MDPRGSPEGIGDTDPPNQLANFLTHLRPARGTAPTFPGPVKAESLPMPGDDRFGLHDKQRRAPWRPEARKPNPKQTVHRHQMNAAVLRPLEHSYLVAES